MSGRPVFQNQFESRCWRHLNGGGPLGRFSAINGGPQSVLEDVRKHEGTVGSALLVSLIDHLGPDVQPEVLAEVVSKSRSRDCMPSVKAAGIMLERGDTSRARELLAMSSGSQEVVRRSVMEARILQREGDMAGARDAACRAFASDPSDPEPYEILQKVDPEGGWPQRRNIQDLVDGRRPECPAGTGRIQQLYQIYFEWFRGNRESASDMLVNSSGYKDGEPEYLLASARMSVDERDWHSANMMFAKLPTDSPPFVHREAAEAALAGGDPKRALELLSKADQASSRVMRDIVRARSVMGDRRGTMEALRSYLDSEWVGSREWRDAVEALLDRGMATEAEELLSMFAARSPKDPDVLIVTSRMQMSSGNLPAALMSAEEAVRGDKADLGAMAQRARVCLAMGNVQRAERECAHILAIDPADVEALGMMARIQAGRGDHAGAVETIRRLLEADPGNSEAMVELASALASTGDADGAEDMCRRSVRVNPGRQSYLRAVSALVSTGAYRSAVYLCRDAESLFPDDQSFKRLRGNAEYAQGEFLRASVTYSEAARLDPSNPVLWYSKGMSDESRGDLESAYDAYSRATSLDPDEPEYWVSKACIQDRRGDRRGAVESLNRAMAKGDMVHAPVIKAGMLSSEGRTAEAIGLLDMVLISAPGDRDALSAKMKAQAASGDGAGALETFSKIPGGDSDADLSALAESCRRVSGKEPAVLDAPTAPEGPAKEPSEVSDEDADDRQEPASAQGDAVPDVPSDPESTVKQDRQAAETSRPTKEEGEANYSMAVSLLEAGDVAGAARASDRALSADPSNPSYLSVRARAAMMSGDADGAVSMLSAAIRGNPDDAGLHKALGDARAARGELTAASLEYDRAVMLGLDDADVHAARGEVLERMGNADRAAECYSAAVSRDPDRLDLSERLARMMLARRESMAADGMVNRILKRDPQRVSAIMLKAEIAQSRKDDAGVMKAYDLFVCCPNPGSENTVRMVRILEETGHSAEARGLVDGHQEPAGQSVKRYAEKVLRRAYLTHTSPADPDIMGALGLDQSTAAAVSAYLSDQRDYGLITPGTDQFRRMEDESREVVMKLGWKDLEGEPRLPLEKVYVQCGYRDCDDAKKVVAYIHKAMLSEPGRKADPRLSEMSMRLPKGMTVYEIMRECDVGVYEARVIRSLII